MALVVLALKDKDIGTYIEGGRDLTMIFGGGDLREPEQDAAVSTAYVTSTFGVKEVAATLLNKATNPTTSSSCTGEKTLLGHLEREIF